VTFSPKGRRGRGKEGGGKKSDVQKPKKVGGGQKYSIDSRAWGRREEKGM